jgi:hypothetical protein
MNVGCILARSKLALAEAGTPVTLRWREFQGEVTVDPVTGAKLGESVERTETVKAHLHFVGAASAVRQHAEVEIGDCIADFAADVELEGKEGLVFEIGGEKWAPKRVSEVLARSWDVVVAGQKLHRTVLLSKSV